MYAHVVWLDYLSQEKICLYICTYINILDKIMYVPC